jgi:hypothetical protein
MATIDAVGGSVGDSGANGLLVELEDEWFDAIGTRREEEEESSRRRIDIV